MLAEQGGGSSHGHLSAQQESIRLEEQGEPAAWSRPGGFDGLDAWFYGAIVAVNAGKASMQEGLMFEEVQMAPNAISVAIIDRAGSSAVGTRELATCGEIEIQVELLVCGSGRIELHLGYLPGRRQAKGGMEQSKLGGW